MEELLKRLEDVADEFVDLLSKESPKGIREGLQNLFAINGNLGELLEWMLEADKS